MNKHGHHSSGGKINQSLVDHILPHETNDITGSFAPILVAAGPVPAATKANQSLLGIPGKHVSSLDSTDKYVDLASFDWFS
jgi:hypothetical protein